MVWFGCDTPVIWSDMVRCHMSVMWWCRCDMVWFECHVMPKWYRCDVRIMCLWCAWYGHIMVWCYMKAMWRAVRLIWVWYGVASVMWTWYGLTCHIHVTHLAPYHNISQKYITIQKFKMTPHDILSYHAITTISYLCHVTWLLYQITLKSRHILPYHHITCISLPHRTNISLHHLHMKPNQNMSTLRTSQAHNTHITQVSRHITFASHHIKSYYITATSRILHHIPISLQHPHITVI